MKFSITIKITDEHIIKETESMGYTVTDMDKLAEYLENKIGDEANESGATHLCLFLQKLIELAYEDNAGVDMVVDDINDEEDSQE